MIRATEEKKYQQIIEKLIKLIENSTISLVERNYEIGKIIKSSQKEFRGQMLIETLSKDLNKRYKEGYSVASLRNMQNFYKKFRNYKELYEHAKKLDWTKNLLLLKIGDIKDTEYYLKSALRQNWPKSKLEKNINEETFDAYIENVESENYKVKINNLAIRNYKSLVNIRLQNPSNFLVFAGPNSSGKSNVFEAVDFLIQSLKIRGKEVFDLFGGEKHVINFAHQAEGNNDFSISVECDDDITFSLVYDGKMLQKNEPVSEKVRQRYIDSFSRIYLGGGKNKIQGLHSGDKLAFDASNLSFILKNILKNDEKKEDIIDYLQLFVPGLKDIDVKPDPFSGEEEIVLFEKDSKRPFKGKLISDGTYHIIALLALLYQSDEQQFLCIEEPENGLNPKITEQFVKLFKEICRTENHYIWLITHSQTLVSFLKPSELVIVDKINGNTALKQFDDNDFNEQITMDEAWLNNILEGGLPW